MKVFVRNLKNSGLNVTGLQRYDLGFIMFIGLYILHFNLSKLALC